MKKPLATAVLCLWLLPAAGFAASIDGVHPHDTAERIVRGTSHRNNKRTWGYGEIQRFYASRYRTYTHMLHPYYRSQPYARYGRIPQGEFRYPYEDFEKEVIREDRVY